MIERQLLSLAARYGYAPAAPEPLISTAFKDTFAPSAYHNLVREASGIDGCVAVGPSAGTQWVYRHVDLQASAFSPVHLIAFRMFVCLESHSGPQRPEAVSKTIDLLHNLFDLAGISRSDLKFTLFGGANSEFSTPVRDSLIQHALVETGFSPAQLKFVPGPSLYALDRRAGELAGPRCEVFARHPQLGYIEIGTIVTEEMVIKSDCKLAPLPLQVTGAAIGVERLQLFTKAWNDILLTVSNQDLRVAEPFSDLAQTHGPSINGFCKGLHAAKIIRPHMTPEIERPYQSRYQQLLRYIHNHRRALGLSESAAEEVAMAIPAPEPVVARKRGPNWGWAGLELAG